jgi:hypothetical protein
MIIRVGAAPAVKMDASSSRIFRPQKFRGDRLPHQEIGRISIGVNGNWIVVQTFRCLAVKRHPPQIERCCTKVVLDNLGRDRSGLGWTASGGTEKSGSKHFICNEL